MDQATLRWPGLCCTPGEASLVTAVRWEFSLCLLRLEAKRLAIRNREARNPNGPRGFANGKSRQLQGPCWDIPAKLAKTGSSVMNGPSWLSLCPGL